MASALMAFVQGLGAEKQDQDTGAALPEKKVPSQDHDEVDEADEDMFGDSGDEQEPRQQTPTLLEVAKQEAVFAAPSLMDVAKSLEVEDDRPKPTLAVLAAELNQEESARETSKAQADKVQRALAAVSSEVKAERVAQRNEQVVSGLKAVVAEQQQQYEDEEFEDDAASVRAAAETLAASVAKAKSVGHRSPARGRSKLLKKGPTSSQSMSKLEMQRAMQDKLSAFQFQQLSLTQRRLFLASLAQASSGNNQKPKKRVANREALNELAKDKFTRARQKQKPRQDFARLDDNRHCRFTPRLHNSSSKKALPSSDSDEEDGLGGKRGAALRRNEDFVRRMEAAERARREQLRRTREEAAYLARVDKKECPRCGNPQSYSELTQKRKKCPNCGVTYKNRIAWVGPHLTLHATLPSHDPSNGAAFFSSGTERRRERVPIAHGGIPAKLQGETAREAGRVRAPRNTVLQTRGGGRFQEDVGRSARRVPRSAAAGSAVPRDVSRGYLGGDPARVLLLAVHHAPCACGRLPLRSLIAYLPTNSMLSFAARAGRL